MKILILGNANAGKTTARKLLEAFSGLSGISSSEFAFDKVVWPAFQEMVNPPYEHRNQCLADKDNRRPEWREFICEYNRPDPSRLCTELLAEFDIYDGMRSREEFLNTIDQFDHILWVERDVPRDSSLDIYLDTFLMTPIINSGSILYLAVQIHDWWVANAPS